MIKSDICQIQQKILAINDEDEKQHLQMHTGNLEHQLATMLSIKRMEKGTGYPVAMHWCQMSSSNMQKAVWCT
uniref:Uncharacterized protein n=1 Tax=Romanomermis culicivorax TaxID=13658 RepID=A0A915KPT3_ROMCU